MGPTAAGKTDLAIELTKVLPCELISVDSALVYRGMDIGTAKPSKESGHPHRLIDILDPAELFGADFRRDALEAMAEITARGKIPLLVGGTMLYYKALIEGLADMPAADPQSAHSSKKKPARLWLASPAEQLASSTRCRRHAFTQRPAASLTRALEVSVERPEADSQRQQQSAQSTEAAASGGNNCPILSPTWRLLRQIARYCTNAINKDSQYAGTGIHRRGLSPAKEVTCTPGRSIRAVGYRQVWDYLDGKLSLAEMQERGIIATRQLAKRQFTWLRSWNCTGWTVLIATICHAP
jgi:tRNA dimethylallyltransferase